MSTKINKILPRGSKRHDKSLRMIEKPSPLAQLVKRIREESGYTLAQVVANSGNTITDGYVSKIENGQTGDVTIEKLVALAKGLRVLPQMLLDAAQGDQPKDTVHINRAIAILRELSEDDQRLGVRLLDVLRDARNENGGDGDPSLKSAPPTLPMASKNLARKKGAKKQATA